MRRSSVTPGGLRAASIPPSARPSAEHVRALEAAGLLEVRLLKKSVQRPLMSVWEGEDKNRDRVLLTVVDACGTPAERDRVIGAAKALLPLAGTAGVQNVRRVLEDVDAFVSDFHGAGTAADLVVLRLPTLRKLDFVCRVCDALAALHAAGVTHGCICAENILLDDDFRPIVTEAGMVSIAGSLEGDPENFFGYGAYAAPETARGAPDARGDIFSVGRLLTFVMLDRAPGDTVDVMDVNAKNPAIAAIVRRCTGPAADRYESMAALSTELHHCRQMLVPSDGETAKRPIEAPPPQRPARPPTPGLAFKPAGKPKGPPAKTAVLRWVGAVGAVGIVAAAVAIWNLGSTDARERGDVARTSVLKGTKDLRGMRLQGADLSALDLTGAQLEKTDLTGATFAKTKLNGAHVDGASFVMVHLEGADLGGTSLDRAYGVETASCDDATLLPQGWYCNSARSVRKGIADSPKR